MLRSPFLMKAWYRLRAALLPSSLSWEDARRPPWAIAGPGRFFAGDWTYWGGDALFRTWKPDDEIRIGAYCSIGGEVLLLAGGDHDVAAISAYPFSLLRSPSGDEAQQAQRIEVGNDVWIGSRAILLGPVTVGDGAVVAAGAVVTHDVPPYALVAGVPARVVHLRFEEAERDALLSLAWWDWPVERVLEAEPLLRSGNVAELVAFAAEHGLAPDQRTA